MDDMSKNPKSIPEEELKKKLSTEQYKLMFEKGLRTEPRFSQNWNRTEKGVYTCAACGNELFSSDAKFELDPSNWNYGWPSFDEPINRENIEIKDDYSFGMHRMEITCKNCGAHLGHVFTDGPVDTTGLHYCVNSCALNFTPKK